MSQDMLVPARHHDKTLKTVRSPNGLEVTVCSLHEHPGGHDGGEFPVYEKFGVSADDTAYYVYDKPISPNNTFGDSNHEDFCSATTKKQALTTLEQLLADSKDNTATLATIIAKFKAAKQYDVIYESFDDEEVADYGDD